MTELSISDALGIIGGITGPMALFFQAREHFLDRSRLRISAHFVRREEIGKPAANAIRINLSNHGRRVARVRSLYFDLSNKKQRTNETGSQMRASKYIPSCLQFNEVDLEEGESVDFNAHPLDAAGIAAIAVDGIAHVVAVDSLGGKHRAKAHIPLELVVQPEPEGQRAAE